MPSSGTITMAQLRTEFGYSGQVNMNTFYTNRYTCRGGGYSMSDWYGYVHAPCTANCGDTIYPSNPYQCSFSDYTSVDVLLGGYTSGSVSVDWSYSAPSGQPGEVRIQLIYNGSVVADTGDVTVGVSGSTTGTLSFTATGADNKYTVKNWAPNCP
jgi:hypothetical protein